MEENTEYMSREEIEATLDKLASTKGLTRAEFDTKLDKLRTMAAGDEHLSTMEAIGYRNLSSERKTHLAECDFCQKVMEYYRNTGARP